jgi:hypothetical protein
VFSKPGLKPAQRAAGADADDDGVDVALQLLIKLRRSGGGMGQRIGVVIKLVDIKGARRFIGKAAGIILIIGRMAFIDVGTGEQHRRAQRPQVKDFLAAHFVRHHQDQAVIFLRRDQRQAEAGIAGGGFDNRSSGRQFSWRSASLIIDSATRSLIDPPGSDFPVLKTDCRAGIQFVQLEQGV